MSVVRMIARRVASRPSTSAVSGQDRCMGGDAPARRTDHRREGIQGEQMVTSAVVRARKATGDDVPALSGVFAAAFLDDPVFTWAIPEDHCRREILPGFFRIVNEANLHHGEIYTTEDVVSGAVWVPPGIEDDSGQLVHDLAEVAAEYAQRCFRALELMDSKHPRDPHYYLFSLGTLPEWQSRGIGSAVMRPVLEMCDRSGMPAYLEASSERNKALYLRHSFEVIDVIQLPEGPPMWCMWRRPR
jgi:ribosomal protein S18 acetylase RimI-like enzyme